MGGWHETFPRPHGAVNDKWNECEENSEHERYGMIAVDQARHAVCMILGFEIRLDTRVKVITIYIYLSIYTSPNLGPDGHSARGPTRTSSR